MIPDRADHLRWGDQGEKIAEAYLTARDWSIVARQFRCKGGEIDIIAAKDDVLAFVEVKARSEDDGFDATIAVRPSKIRRLVTAARTWLVRNEDDPILESHAPRFDVITVVGRENPVIEHLEDAFEAPGG